MTSRWRNSTRQARQSCSTCSIALRREGFSIIVAEHHLDELLPRADRVLVLDQGRLSADCTRSDPTLPHALDTAGLIVEGRDVPFCAGPSIQQDGPCGTTIVRAGSLEMRFPRQVGPLWRRLDFQIQSGQRGYDRSQRIGQKHSFAPAGRLHATLGRANQKSKSDGAGTVPVALVPQNPDLTLFSATVELELGYGPRQLGVAAAEVDERILAAAASLGLDALLAEPPLALGQGQRLRVALAAALTLRPRLLLLDEPTTGQDPREVQRLLSVIIGAVDSGEVGAVVFSTHDLRIASLFATRALLLADGQLLADGPAAEVLADQTLIHHAHLRRLPARPDEISALPSFTATSNRARRSPMSYVELLSPGRDTWLCRDARLKIVWLVVVSLAAVVVDSTAALLILCGLALVVAVSLGWSRGTWLVVGGILLTVAWGTVFSQALFYPVEPRRRS